MNVAKSFKKYSGAPGKKGKVEKAREPVGSKIQPEDWNGSTTGQTVGGYGDAAAGTGQRGVNTARYGAGEGARQTNADPTMSPPTPYPGQPGRAKPNPLTPPRTPPMTGPMGSSRPAEGVGSRMAMLARGGGKVPVNPASSGPAALPVPTPTFPAADNPGGSALPGARSGGGKMQGQIQGSQGKASSGNTKIQE